MNITRHNYEEFFILYLDNELSLDARAKVEAFAAANPDLREELDILLQSRLVPDMDIVFADKEELLKIDGHQPFSEANYEEWLVLYIDNELNPAQRATVEQFVAAKPAAQQELELLQRTKFSAEESIVFPDKQSLYRKEEKSTRVVFITWRRIAVAAAILFAVSTAAFFLFKNNDVTTVSQDGIAGKNTEPVVKPEENTAVKQPAPKDDVTRQEMASNDQYAEQVPIEKETVKDPVKESISVPEKKKGSSIVIPREQQLASMKEKKQDNNLPAPTYNPNVKDAVIENNPIAYNKPERPSREALTIQKDFNQTSTVTPDMSGSLDNVIAVSSPLVTNDNEPADDVEPGRKNKLRGFFRKITRTFEKTTNIKATDDEDRLLVGGLAIRL